jgi:hypothetical protein
MVVRATSLSKPRQPRRLAASTTRPHRRRRRTWARAATIRPLIALRPFPARMARMSNRACAAAASAWSR